MITDSRPIWDASLAEILSQPAAPGTRASATDIPGVNLEWMATNAYPAGAWFGDCGQPTLAQLYALPTTYLAFGARASVLGIQYAYGAAGWVEAGGGVLAPTILSRHLRICTFGSSLATPNANVAEWDIENLNIAIPASGFLPRTMSPLGAPSLYMGRNYLVGVGGIGGNNSADMLARSIATPSSSRKSVTDIISKKPDIVLMMGGTINDIKGTIAGSDVEAVASSSFGKHEKVVNMFTSQGTYVIDMGVYGYSGGGSGDTATIQAVAVSVNNKCKSISSPYYRLWDVDGVMGENGGFYPANTTDGVHLSSLGAFVAGLQQKKIIDKLFRVICGFGVVLYDGAVDWGTPTSGVPANCSITPSMSSVVKVSDVEALTVTGSVDALGQGFTFKMNKVKDALNLLSPGDKFFVDVNIYATDNSGNEIDCFVDAICILFDSGNVGYLSLGQSGGAIRGQSRMTITGRVPSNAPLGASSYVQVVVKPFTPGFCKIKLSPIMVYSA